MSLNLKLITNVIKNQSMEPIYSLQDFQDLYNSATPNEKKELLRKFKQKYEDEVTAEEEESGGGMISFSIYNAALKYQDYIENKTVINISILDFIEKEIEELSGNKSSLSKKPTEQKPVKEFKDFFANKDNAAMINQFKRLLTDESKSKKDRGRIIRYMTIDKLFDPRVRLVLKDFIKSLYGSKYTERIYDAIQSGYNDAKLNSKGELSPEDKKLKDSVLNPFNPPTDSAD